MVSYDEIVVHKRRASTPKLFIGTATFPPSKWWGPSMQGGFVSWDKKRGTSKVRTYSICEDKTRSQQYSRCLPIFGVVVTANCLTRCRSALCKDSCEADLYPLFIYSKASKLLCAVERIVSISRELFHGNTELLCTDE